MAEKGLKRRMEEMFDDYEDVIDLIMAVRESRFDCSGLTTVCVFTAWGFCTLYPKAEEREEEPFAISYLKLLEVLDLAIPGDARKVPHDLTVKNEQQMIYGGEDSPVEIFINQFPDKTEMTIFVAYTTKQSESPEEDEEDADS